MHYPGSFGRPFAPSQEAARSSRESAPASQPAPFPYDQTAPVDEQQAPEYRDPNAKEGT